MSQSQVDARFVAEQARQAHLFGDSVSAQYLFAQAQAIDPAITEAILSQLGETSYAVADAAIRPTDGSAKP